jgi:hypothetical protein
MHSFVLPTGNLAIMNGHMMQVINPQTGDALAQAPPLAGVAKWLTWE